MSNTNWKIKDKCKVYSESNGGWVNGEIAQIGGSMVTIYYGDDYEKELDLDDPEDLKLIKKVPENKPIVQPVVQPVVKPVVQPVVSPTVIPVLKPVVQPVVSPTVIPVLKPVVQPVVKPVVKPITNPIVSKKLVHPSVLNTPNQPAITVNKKTQLPVSEFEKPNINLSNISKIQKGGNQNNIENTHMDLIGEKEIWSLIDSYFKNTKNYLAKHQIDSFNNLINIGIPKTLKQYNPVTSDYLVESEGKNISLKLELFFGAQLIDDEIIDDGSQIFIGRPVIREKNKNDTFNVKILYPNEARLKNLTYSTKIFTDIICKFTSENIETKNKKEFYRKLEKVSLGEIPIMLQSKICSLYASNKKLLREMGECENDHGGYFIIQGKEKVIVGQERQIENKLYIVKSKESDETYKIESEIRSSSENTFEPARVNEFFIMKEKKTSQTIILDNSIRVKIPTIMESIPLFIIFRALGIISDYDICKCIFNMDYLGKSNLQLETQLDVLRSSIIEGSIVSTQDDALEYLINKVDSFMPPKISRGKQKKDSVDYGKIYILKILRNHFLPHCGTNFLNKSYFLGTVINDIINVYLDIEPPTDKDSYMFKRIDISGLLCGLLFRDIFFRIKNDMKEKINKTFAKFNEGSFWINQFEEESENKNIKFFYLLSDKDEGYKHINKIVNEKILSDSFLSAFRKCWGLANARGGKCKAGVVQDLARDSYFGTVSHIRRVNNPLSDSSKIRAPHVLHLSSYGIMCPSETPDGARIGLRKNISLFASITAGTSSFILIRMLHDLKMIPINKVSLTRHEYCKIFLNGKYLGNISNPKKMFEKLKLLKRNAFINIYTSISWDIFKNRIIISTDSGRGVRPVFVVKNNKLLVTEDKIKKGWANLVFGDSRELSEMSDTDPIYYDTNLGIEELEKNQGVIEYIDCNESNMSLIAMNQKQLNDDKSNYDYCEIHPGLIFSILGNVVPALHMNQAPRNQFSTAHGKQCLGMYATNYRNRMDNKGQIVYYPQKPIISSTMGKYLYSDVMAKGCNVVMAVGCYSGYNQEDSIIFNKSSLDRGLFRTTVFRTYNDSENVENGKVTEKIELFNPNDVSNFVKGNYNKLDNNGIVKEGEKVFESDIIISKTTKITSSNSNTTDKKNVSLLVKKNEYGVVDKVYSNFGNDNQRYVKIRLRKEKIPEVGDKFASRHGQKGTVGMVLEKENMPFTKFGLVPDIIVNPHAFPSRMTIGQFYETIFGKFCLENGILGEVSPFSEINMDDIMSSLEKKGFEKNGNEILYSGITGNQLKVNLFIGPNYYQRLYHQVADKYQSRDSGPTTQLTHQPVSGRALGGGGRIGEMERDAILSHGMVSFLKESFMERSDKFRFYISKKSGLISVCNKRAGLYRDFSLDEHIEYRDNNNNNYKELYSESKNEFVCIEAPYSFKLFIQELQTAHIGLRLITEDLYKSWKKIFHKMFLINNKFKNKLTTEKLLELENKFNIQAKINQNYSKEMMIFEIIGLQNEIEKTLKYLKNEKIELKIIEKSMIEFENKKLEKEQEYKNLVDKKINNKNEHSLLIRDNFIKNMFNDFSKFSKDILFDSKNTPIQILGCGVNDVENKSKFKNKLKLVDFSSIEKNNNEKILSFNKKFGVSNLENIKLNDQPFKNSVEYFFEKIYHGVFVEIKNNRLNKFIPFYNDANNSNFNNKWHKKIKNIPNVNYRKIKSIEYQYNKPQLWTTNNCLIGNWKDIDKPSGKGLKQFYQFINLILKNYHINDSCFILNKRDHPTLKITDTEPYFHIHGNNQKLEDKFCNKTYIPVLSFCSNPEFMDLLIPTPDTLSNYIEGKLLKIDIKITESVWENKINKAVFRGSSTGCGFNEFNNQRLNISLKRNDQWFSNHIDAKLTSVIVRDRIYGGLEGNPEFISIDKSSIERKHNVTNKKLTYEEQKKFKFILHVDGHVSAYRLLNELSFGSIILKVKSMHNYKLWFSKKMIKLNEDFSNFEKAHYIEINENLDNLKKMFDWCQKNPKKSVQICNNSIELYNKLIEYIPEYFCSLMNNISSIYRPEPNEYFAKKYLLNLDRDLDKKVIMTKELINIGFRNVANYRFSAVNGIEYLNTKLLKISKLDGVKGLHPDLIKLKSLKTNDLKFWKVLNKINDTLTNYKLLGNVKDIEDNEIKKKYNQQINLKDRESDKVIRKILRPGQIGHYQSFIEIFKDAQKIYKNDEMNNKPILILEDDCKFTSNFMYKLKKLFTSLPEDWGIIYLGLHDGYFESIKNKNVSCQDISENVKENKVIKSIDNNCDTRGITIDGTDENNWNLIFKKEPSLKKYLKDKRKFPYKNISIKEFFELNFPNIKSISKENKNKLQLSPCGLYSITVKRDQDNILSAMKKELKDVQNIKITDICGGNGIDALNFITNKLTSEVIVYELEKGHREIIYSNFKQYNLLKNLKIKEEFRINSKINTNVLYADPPWGGVNYVKGQGTSEFKFIDHTIDDLTIELFKNNPKLDYIFWKLPKSKKINKKLFKILIFHDKINVMLLVSIRNKFELLDWKPKKNDICYVYSESNNQWLKAKIEKIENNLALIFYGKDFEFEKELDLNDPDDLKLIKKNKSDIDENNSKDESKFDSELLSNKIFIKDNWEPKVGDDCLIYNSAINQWLKGRIIEINKEEALVFYGNNEEFEIDVNIFNRGVIKPINNDDNIEMDNVSELKSINLEKDIEFGNKFKLCVPNGIGKDKQVWGTHAIIINKESINEFLNNKNTKIQKMPTDWALSFLSLYLNKYKIYYVGPELNNGLVLQKNVNISSTQDLNSDKNIEKNKNDNFNELNNEIEIDIDSKNDDPLTEIVDSIKEKNIENLNQNGGKNSEINWEINDKCQVYSESSEKWIEGKIGKIEGNKVTVFYKKNNEEFEKELYLNDPDDLKLIKKEESDLLRKIPEENLKTEYIKDKTIEEISKKEDSEKEDSEIKNVKIQFGHGSKVWYNGKHATIIDNIKGVNDKIIFYKVRINKGVNNLKNIKGGENNIELVPPEKLSIDLTEELKK